MHFCPDKKCMDPVLNLDNDPIQFVPPKCCYFVVVGGLACLADPRGYASWSFDSW